MTEQVDWSVDCINDGRDFFELAIEYVLIGVATFAATPPIHRVYGELFGYVPEFPSRSFQSVFMRVTYDVNLDFARIAGTIFEWCPDRLPPLLGSGHRRSSP